MNDLECITLNVRGLRGKKKYKIYRWLKDHKFDICLLQETYCTKDYIDIMNRGWNGQIFHSVTSSSHSRGVSILIKKDLPCHVINHFTDDNGRVLLLNLEMKGKEYTICNIYAPNLISERIEFLRNLNQFLEAHAMSLDNMLIGGDFNCVEQDIDRVSGCLERSSQTLSKIISDMKLIDVWRLKHPASKEYTYIDPSHKGHDSRIDLWLISHSVYETAKACKITESPAPDHRAVCLTLNLITKTRGAGYWKLNNSVLKENQYKEGITTLFNNLNSEYSDHVSRQVLWDFVKAKVKQYTISYCINKV